MPRHTDRYSNESLRLIGYDYTRPGAYFVTICIKDRHPLFGRILRGQMCLSDCGRIVREEWHRTDALRDNVQLDAFVVMPGYVHGIIVLVRADYGPVRPLGYELDVFTGINTDSDDT